MLSELRKHNIPISDEDIVHEKNLVRKFQAFGYEIHDLDQLGYIKDFTADETKCIIEYISLFEHLGTIDFLIRCLGRKGNVTARNWLIDFILNPSNYIYVDSTDRRENYKWLAYLTLTKCIKTKSEKEDALKLISNDSISTTREMLTFLAKNGYKGEIVQHILLYLPDVISNNDDGSIVGFLEIASKVIDPSFKIYIEKFSLSDDKGIRKMSDNLLKKKYSNK